MAKARAKRAGGKATIEGGDAAAAVAEAADSPDKFSAYCDFLEKYPLLRLLHTIERREEEHSPEGGETCSEDILRAFLAQHSGLSSATLERAEAILPGDGTAIDWKAFATLREDLKAELKQLAGDDLAEWAQRIAGAVDAEIEAVAAWATLPAGAKRLAESVKPEGGALTLEDCRLCSIVAKASQPAPPAYPPCPADFPLEIHKRLVDRARDRGGRFGNQDLREGIMPSSKKANEWLGAMVKAGLLESDNCATKRKYWIKNLGE